MEQINLPSQPAEQPLIQATLNGLPIELKQQIIGHVVESAGGYVYMNGHAVWTQPYHSSYEIKANMRGKKAWLCFISKAWYEACLEFFVHAV